MRPLREMVALVRLAQTELAVRAYEHDLQRARAGLDRALVAREAALAEVRHHEHEPTGPAAVPAFLVREAA